MIVVAGCIVASCANRGIGPQGGPKDSIPPMVVKEEPLNGSLNYKDKKVEITFNEYIQLDKVVDNVLISPPQQKPPQVKARGKKVVVTFEQELQDSTTYTISFGDAICDFTEKNPLSGYTFSFATADSFDSLQIYGLLVNAEDLNPVSGVIVGIQSNMHDSAFTTEPFTRIAKTNKDGEFAIYNIHQGDYRLYALQDVSRDYVYQPGEGLAFSDEIITPIMETEQHLDTIFHDSISVDTIYPDSIIGDTLFIAPMRLDTVWHKIIDSVYTHTETLYGPANLVLWFFKEDKQRHYFQRASREQAHRMQFVFSAPQDSLPTFRALPASAVDTLRSDTAVWEDWMDYTLWQYNSRKDTITCWLTDSSAISADTLYLEMNYLKSDSVYQLQPETDTLMLVYRAPRLTEKAKALQEKKDRERKLLLRSNAKATFEVFDTLCFSTDFPVADMLRDSIRLYQKIDSVYTELDYELIQADSSRMRYMAVYQYQPEKMYELRIDSAAMHDIYGAPNEATKFQMKLRSLEEYATIKVKLKSFDAAARIQLLNEKEQVVVEKAAEADGTLFQYLAPKEYYMRLYIDLNGDGRWTTGDWATKRQPEPVYYFPAKLSLRANWDFEEIFDHLAIPQLDSKPQEIIKDAMEKKK